MKTEKVLVTSIAPLKYWIPWTDIMEEYPFCQWKKTSLITVASSSAGYISSEKCIYIYIYIYI